MMPPGDQERVAPCLRVTSLSLRYGDLQALADIDFEAKQGVTLVLGRNGAGKSSMCRVLAGALRPDTGSVDWTARDANEKGRRHFLRLCGWLPQSFEAPSSMSVVELLEYASWLKEIPRSRVTGAIGRALDATDLADRADDKIGTLSGGMVRRLGIAQALVNDPVFLILDEPTAGLDPEQRAGFHDIIRATAHDRVVLLSTHLLEDAIATSGHVLVLDRGRVVHRGSLAALESLGAGRDRTERLRTAFLSVVNGEHR